MSFTRAKNTFIDKNVMLIACGLLAMMILPVEAQTSAKTTSNGESLKQLSKERKKEEKSEKSTERADKTAEKEAEAAQAREKSLPSHEDHHKLGAHDRVDKGFDFNTSNSK